MKAVGWRTLIIRSEDIIYRGDGRTIGKPRD